MRLDRTGRAINHGPAGCASEDVMIIPGKDLMDDLRRFIAEMPFPVCISLFETILDVLLDRDHKMGLVLKRRYLGIGYALYEVYVQKTTKLGEIWLQQIGEKSIIVHLRDTDKESLKFLQLMVVALWKHYQELLEIEKLTPKLSDIIFDGPEIEIDISSLLNRKQSEISEPRKGASIDLWLDYRDNQAKHGRRITLDTIAEKSGHSLSTLRKHSAGRKPRRTK